MAIVNRHEVILPMNRAYVLEKTNTVYHVKIPVLSPSIVYLQI